MKNVFIAIIFAFFGIITGAHSVQAFGISPAMNTFVGVLEDSVVHGSFNLSLPQASEDTIITVIADGEQSEALIFEPEIVILAGEPSVEFVFSLDTSKVVDTNRFDASFRFTPQKKEKVNGQTIQLSVGADVIATITDVPREQIEVNQFIFPSHEYGEDPEFTIGIKNEGNTPFTPSMISFNLVEYYDQDSQQTIEFNGENLEPTEAFQNSLQTLKLEKSIDPGRYNLTMSMMNQDGETVFTSREVFVHVSGEKFDPLARKHIPFYFILILIALGGAYHLLTKKR